MSADLLILILLSANIIQGLFIMYSSHKWANKLMSRTFHEYKVADNLTPRKDKPKVQEEVVGPNELGVLNEFLR